jgi:polyisoprenoid-binding protein YceI
MMTPQSDRLALTPDSKLWIEGTSTIHDWTCEVGSFTGNIEIVREGNTLQSISAVDLAVPVTAIECHNKTMVKKAQQALKAETSPTIQFALNSATIQPAASGSFAVQALGRLTLAGVTHEVTMTLNAKSDSSGFRFEGQVPIQMSQYNVDPPTAMLGTLKTGNEVVVHFNVLGTSAGSQM